MNNSIIKSAAVGLLVVASGCVPGNNPVRVTGAFAVTSDMDTTCAFQTDLQQVSGRLDVNGAGKFFLNFGLVSELSPATFANSQGETLSTQGQNNFIADELVLSYTSRNPTITFETERIPVYFVVLEGAEHQYITNIIGEKAFVKLRDNVTDPAADPKTTLLAKVEIKGHLESGGTVSANPFTFPITVFASANACPMGVAPTGICGGNAGQDGQPIVCCTGPGAPLGCP